MASATEFGDKVLAQDDVIEVLEAKVSIAERELKDAKERLREAQEVRSDILKIFGNSVRELLKGNW